MVCITFALVYVSTPRYWPRNGDVIVGWQDVSRPGTEVRRCVAIPIASIYYFRCSGSKGRTCLLGKGGENLLEKSTQNCGIGA